MEASPPEPVPGHEPRRAAGARFNLIRWFSFTALFSVAAVSAIAAWALANFLTYRMIHHDAEVTADFVRGIVEIEAMAAYFELQQAPGASPGEFLSHLAALPGVARINIYGADRRMLWSSDKALIGRRFDHNDELEEALQARLVVSSGVVASRQTGKSEHEDIERRVPQFVESYVPIFTGDGRRVIGVVEMYRVPDRLFDTIHDGVRLIWGAAAAAGLFLYAALFWIVRRAHRTIEAQREQLIEAESLALVGEMGAAVAHGLRNPLSSIRSSAELALESPLPPQARECATDIVSQVDRLEGWVRQLLTYARPSNAHIEPVDVNAVLTDTLNDYRRDLDRLGVASRLDLAESLPAIRGEPALLGQLLGSLIANAMDAMPKGGEIVLHSHFDAAARQVVVELRDNGPGMAPEALAKVFKPFFTSKAKGLGLGLPLVRRVIERLGGSVALASTPGAGTTVRMLLPPYP